MESLHDIVASYGTRFSGLFAGQRRDAVRRLLAIDWQVDVTDDVRRCLLCWAQDTHTETCPHRRLEGWLAQQETRHVGM